MAATTHHKSAKPGKKPTTTSSHGDSPQDIVPKDISPDNATWKDRTNRNIYSDDIEEKTDALLDEASDLSFPASDPIAVSSITRIEKKAKPGTRSAKGKS